MPKKNLIWLLALVTAAMLLLVATRPRHTVGPKDTGEFESVLRAYSLIRRNYYREPDTGSLRRGAVRGMVEQLDEFSSYVPPTQLRAFEDELMGLSRGLGIRLDYHDGKAVVLGPLPDSPAARAGIQAGDVLLDVDGRDLDELSPEEVEELLAGRPGEAVRLTIARKDFEPHTISLTRREFPLEIIQGLYRDGDGQWVTRLGDDDAPAYLRLSELVPRAPEELHAAFRKLDRPTGLVLDLRDDPGGHLASASGVADLFLRGGDIMTVVHRDDRTDRYRARADGTLPEVPMVVLINAGTASGAEIIAGALRMHGRAVLVGTRTRGKGCIQSMYRLGDDVGQINLTTSEFYVGRARPITRRPGSDVWGVDPHEEVVLRPAEIEQLTRLRHEAEVLPGPATKPANEQDEQTRSELQRLLEVDRQLARAVELLKDPDTMSELLEHGANEDLRLERMFLRRRERADLGEDKDED